MKRKRVVIVGASGGIGRAIVETYCDEDVSLYLSANRGAEALESAMRSSGRRNVRVFKADFSERLGAVQLENALLEAARQDDKTDVPRFDALVVASGLDLMTSSAKALSFDERLDLIFRTDVAATIRLARTLGASMRERARRQQEEDYRPSVVLFGWDGVERGQEGETAQLYAASKGAVVAFARALAQELAPEVRTNVVSPGWIKTAWGSVASPRAERRVARESLSGRWGGAEEIARVVRFLLSESASYVNGQTIAVNGGFSYRNNDE